MTTAPAHQVAAAMSRLAGPALSFLRQELARRGAAIAGPHSGMADVYVAEALDTLRSYSATAFGHLAIRLRVALSNPSDLLLEQPTREWLRSPETERLVKAAAVTHLNGGGLDGLLEQAGESYARSSGDFAWYGQAVFSLATAFVVATLEAKLAPDMRVGLHLLTANLAAVDARSEARHAEVLGLLGVRETAAGDDPVTGPAILLERIERLVANAAGEGDMAEVAAELRALALAFIQSISASGRVPLAVFAAPLSRFEEDRVEDLLAMDLSAVISTIHAKAEAYRQLRASVDAPNLMQSAQRDSALMAGRQRLADYLAAGKLDAASAELAAIVDRIRELSGPRAAEQDALRMFEISLIEEQGRLEGLKGNNVGAAERFMSAAQLVPLGGDDQRVRLLSLSLEEVGIVARRSGDPFWGQTMLARAEDLQASIARIIPGEAKAEALTSLSRAYWVRGRSANVDRLDDSIVCARAAVEMTASQSPLLAPRLRLLADAFMRRWEAGSAPDDHARAIGAIIDGLRCAASPDERAGLLNLQASLAIEEGRRARLRGERDAAISSFEHALGLLDEVQGVWTRAYARSDWAMARLNASIALSSLGELKASVPLLLEAKSVAEQVREVYTERTDAVEWARQTNILGMLCKRILVLANDLSFADEGMSFFNDCQRVRSYRDRQIEWASTEENKGWLLEVVFDRTGDQTVLARAVEHVRAALDSFERLLVSAHVTKAKNKLDQLMAKQAIARLRTH